MKTKEIVQKVMDYKGMKVAPFAEFVGVTPQSIYDIMAERTINMSPRLRAKICQQIPEVNPSWLATGDGCMLRPYNSVEQNTLIGNNKNSNVDRELLDKLTKSQEHIDRLLTIIEKLTGEHGQ